MSRYLRNNVFTVLCAFALAFAATATGLEAQTEDPILFDDDDICCIQQNDMYWVVPAAHQSALEWYLNKSGEILSVAQFVSGLAMTHLRAEMHVCGAPKPLEDTVFMMTRYQGEVPGTLMATRQAPGNRGGLRLRVFGSEGGVEWDLEKSEDLKFNRYGEPDRIVSRGHGHGVSARTERLVRTARGFPEGIIEAWSNLYTEFALAVAARRDGVAIPADWLLLPRVEDGAIGVGFVEATVRSHEMGGAWVNT